MLINVHDKVLIWHDLKGNPKVQVRTTGRYLEWSEWLLFFKTGCSNVAQGYLRKVLILRYDDTRSEHIMHTFKSHGKTPFRPESFLTFRDIRISWTGLSEIIDREMGHQRRGGMLESSSTVMKKETPREINLFSRGMLTTADQSLNKRSKCRFTKVVGYFWQGSEFS